jgi:RNA ligase (TIGR02306 family)
MTTIKVTIETVSHIDKHPNADRLEIASLEGVAYRVVVPLGQYLPGDKVVYFPIDSVIPEHHLNRLGLAGKLAGQGRTRLKTVEIRGVASQGLIAKPSELDIDLTGDMDCLTEMLGVTKYEPPQMLNQGESKGSLPFGCGAYDIDNVQAVVNFVSRLFEEDVDIVVEEKMEGSNVSVWYDGTDIIVCSHHTVRADGPNYYWTASRNAGVLDHIKNLYTTVKYDNPEVTAVVVYGEVLGPKIQGNIYKLPEITMQAFDIGMVINGKLRYVNTPKAVPMAGLHNIPFVPILYRGKISGFASSIDDLVEKSNGNSVLFDTAREGIVIKMVEEQFSHELRGRSICKVRSPKYLAKHDS